MSLLTLTFGLNNIWS